MTMLSGGDTIDRRTVLLGGVAVAALAGAVPYLATPIGTGIADQVALLDGISEALIPGSSALAPGAYLAERMPAGFLDLELAQVRLVGMALGRRNNGDFLMAAPPRRHALLAMFDTEMFGTAAEAASAKAWRTLKSALLSVYYTSEQGASRDLPYELVPGRWQPDLPLAEQPRPLSNDTLARWFT